MAKYFGAKIGKVFLDDAAGTPVDITRYVTSIETDEESEQLDATAFGATGRERIPGFSSGVINLGANYDAVLFRLLHGIKREQATDPAFTTTYAWGPEGNAAGKVKYTGEALLTRFGRTGQVSGVTTITGAFRISGPNTETTWP